MQKIISQTYLQKVAFNPIDLSSAEKLFGIKKMFFFILTACFVDGRHDIDVIGVDWTEGSSDPFYIHSANRVQCVGKAVARFIGQIIQKGLINSNNLELIGHSLGAHVSGFGEKLPKLIFKIEALLI